MHGFDDKGLGFDDESLEHFITDIWRADGYGKEGLPRPISAFTSCPPWELEPKWICAVARGEEETATCAQVLVGGHREHFSVCAFSRKGRQGSDWDGLMEGEERSGRGSKGVGETEFCSKVRVWAGSALAVAVPCP